MIMTNTAITVSANQVSNSFLCLDTCLFFAMAGYAVFMDLSLHANQLLKSFGFFSFGHMALAAKTIFAVMAVAAIQTKGFVDFFDLRIGSKVAGH